MILPILHSCYTVLNESLIFEPELFDRLRMGSLLMIVDNDFDDRYFFRNAIREIDPSLECIHAEHGVEALEKLGVMDRLPDAVFLDLNMPLMNGWKCLEEIKSSEKLRHLPIIIYTTSDAAKDREMSEVSGADYYLVKPPDLADLPEEISKALKHIQIL